MGEKHSAVGYLFREGAFLPAQETKPVRNEFGLDLFQHRGSVYEGKTGLQFCSLQQAEDLAGFVEKHGGIEKVQKLIADSLERTGLSPRYTRPDEKKKDIFPPKEKPIMVTEKSKAIRITLNGTFGKCPEIIIGMAS